MDRDKVMGPEKRVRRDEERRRRRRFTARQAAKRIVALHAAEHPGGGHGSSFSLYLGDVSDADLYAVSPYELVERRVAGPSLTTEQLEAYVQFATDLLRRPDHVVGTWWNPREDITYLDVSVLVETEAEARALAEQHGQRAFFHLKSKTTIDLE